MENVISDFDSNIFKRKRASDITKNMLNCSEHHLYAINVVNEVKAFGVDVFNLLSPDGMDNIRNIEISSEEHNQIICVKNDGSVLWFGSNYCPNETNKTDTWKNIVSVSVDSVNCKVAAGLMKDGTVVYSADSDYNVSSWFDIKQIVCGSSVIVGLKKDGSVVYALANRSENFRDSFRNLKNWKDVKSICACDTHVYGLKEDCTVLCSFESNSSYIHPASQWKDIVELKAVSSHHLIGLKKDGTVVECDIGRRTGYPRYGDSSKWSDIISIYGSYSLTVGLTSEGKIKVHTSDNSYHLDEAETWSDIIHVACSDDNIFGLTSHGRVLFCGSEEFISRKKVENLRLFSDINNLENERNEIKLKRQREYEEKCRLHELRNERIRKGLCRHCGGSFKGLIVKKCVDCGHKKDY